MILLLLAAEAAGPDDPSRPRPTVPIGRQRCVPATDPNEVVVCAQSPDAYRLKPLPPKADDPPLPRAGFRVGKSDVAAEVEQGSVGGIPTNRVKLCVKVPF